MKKFAIGALSVLASVAFAMDTTTNGTTTESTTTGTSPIKVFANVDLNMNKLDISSSSNPSGTSSLDMGFNLAVGADGVYMFTDTIGAGLGLDFNMLSGEKSVTGGKIKVSNNYLDVPVSFAYNVMATEDLGFMILAGPYFGIPLSKWDVKSPGNSQKDKSNVAIGANLETHATWKLTDTVALGGHLGFKYAFNDLDKDATGTQKYWGISVGVGAKFL